MKPSDFVTRVINTIEGVIIDDLYPIDDKYREVLMQSERALNTFMQYHD